MSNNTSNLKYARKTIYLLILGFIFVIIPFVLIFGVSKSGQIVQRIEFVQNPASGQLSPRAVDITPLDPAVPYSLAVNALGWLFSLYCIYRIVRTIKNDDPGFPLGIRKTVLLNLIPVFNLYWVFVWTRAIVAYINAKLSRNFSSVLPGMVLFFAGLLACLASMPPRPGTLGHAVSLALVLVVEMQLGRKICRVIARDIGGEKQGQADPA